MQKTNEKKVDDKVIKDAQYRKGLSIAFFNATNNALAIMQAEKWGEKVSETAMQERIVFWRDWLLNEHKNYYATVIANVGVNYNAEETIKKLHATENYAELSAVWISLSEDERRDGEILKVAREMKKKYHEEA